jgi:hypothetical protein
MEIMIDKIETKKEDLPCMDVLAITKKLATQTNKNYGGSEARGSLIKGGQNGEA